MRNVVGRVGRASLIVLIGLFSAGVALLAQGGDRRPPSGPVRALGHAVGDADGPFNALGATLFWGAWGYKFDRTRLERNLAAMNNAGVDYIRVLGSVGGPGWTDREADPRWTDYDMVIAGLTDLAYDRFGMRVQWTLFGGAPSTLTGAAREALVDRFARLARGREHKIFAFEIANEARSNGFEGAAGVAELRRLGKRLNDQTPVLVALSAPATGAACETYAKSGADAATIHYHRAFGSDGPLTPLLRPWSYPADFDVQCRGQLPAIVFNNEPIGPESSVAEDDDASRIVAAYALTFLANNAAYVLHTGPGIRGGGAADVAPAVGRHANMDELPSFASIATALSAARRYLPSGLANWTRHEPGAANAPVRGERVYAASFGNRFVALVVPGKDRAVLRVQRASLIDVRQTSTGRIVRRLDVAAGEPFTLNSGEPLILVGRRSQR